MALVKTVGGVFDGRLFLDSFVESRVEGDALLYLYIGAGQLNLPGRHFTLCLSLYLCVFNTPG